MRFTIKKAISIMLVVIILVGIMPNFTLLEVNAEVFSGTEADGVKWEIDTELGVMNMTGTGPMTKYYDWQLTPYYTVSKTNIKKINVGEGITNVGENAFCGFLYVEEIALPETVNRVGFYGFYDCQLVEELYLPNITEAAGNAFGRCYNLKSVVLGEELKTIKEYAFIGCKSLEYIYLSDKITTIGSQAFKGCESLTDVYYEGTEEQWNKVSIANDFDEFSKATIHFNSTNPDSQGGIIVPNDAESSYVQEHLNFVNSSKFTERMNTSWSEIISSGLDTPTGNFAEGFYHVLNSTSEFLDCKALGVFENPYDAVITELILKQSDLQLNTFELTYKTEMYKNVEYVEKLCKASSYSDEWMLKEEEYKTHLEKLIADPKSMKEENEGFYNLCTKIFGEMMEKEELDKWLKAYGKAGELIGALEDYANVVNWVSDCAKYTAMVEAYINTSDEFKATLLWAAVEMEGNIYDTGNDYTDGEILSRVAYAEWYMGAVDKYCAFLTEDKIAELLFEEYTQNALKRTADVFGKTIRKNAIIYVSEGLGLTKAAASWVFAAIEAYQTGWAISEAITNNGSIVECRELARASYYLEDALDDFVVDMADCLEKDQSLQSAKNFDAAYTLLQDVECYALENYAKYLRVQQESFVQGIIHFFRPYNFAEIENCKVLILEWQNACCHKEVPKVAELSDVSVVKVCCPTDVHVYDKNQQLVFSVTNNEVVLEERCVTGCVVGDMKYIFLPDIKNYGLDIVATDNGEMSVFINTYNSENGELIKSTSYVKETIEKDDVYEISADESPVLSHENTVIPPTSVAESEDELVPVTAIEIENVPSELYVGEEVVLSADVLPKNANCPIVNWTSSDNEILHIDENGVLVAKKKGEAKIVCSSVDGSGIYHEFKIAVNEKESVETNSDIKVKEILITGISDKIAAGKTIRLDITVKPSNAKDKSVTWKTSNKKYATVDEKGVVVLKKEGVGKTVTITATANDGSGIKALYKIKIMEHAVKKLKLKGISKKIAAGKSIKIKPVIKTTGKSANKILKWSSSNEKYATVTSEGVVKTKKAGKGKRVVIRAMATDGSGKCAEYTIKIMKHRVKKIKLKASQTIVKAGQNVVLKADIKTSGKNANKVLKWKSSNKKYATVTKEGVVKTKSAGKGRTVTITAVSTDGTNKKAKIKIKIK